MFYFFKTVVESSRERLKPLPGQYFGGGSRIDASFNVQADKVIRGSYPVGTIFGSDNLVLVGETFYKADNIKVVVATPKEPSHAAPKAMQDAYIDFTKGITPTAPDDAPEATTPFGKREESTSEKPKRRRKTYLEKLQDEYPYEVSDDFYISQKDWYFLIRNITNNINTMLVGPSGTGKTEMIYQIAEAMGGIPVYTFDMGAMLDPIPALLGTHRLKDGHSVFEYARFTQMIQEECIILLDELSRAPLSAMNILFPCLDSRRCLYVDIAGNDDEQIINVHPDCVFIATANVGSEYTGTLSMDRALVNRFLPLEVDFLPEDKEVAVLKSRTGIDKATATKIITVAAHTRDLFKTQELSSCMTTRETLAVAELCSDGWSVVEALEMIVAPQYEGTKSTGERGMIMKVITSR